MGIMQLKSINAPKTMFPAMAPILPHVTVKDIAVALKYYFLFNYLHWTEKIKR